MEPPDVNEILTIGNTLESNGLSIRGIVKKSGEYEDGRIWAQVWYNDAAASYVGLVEWRESGWLFSERSYETLRHEWKSAIENMIARAMGRVESARLAAAGH